KGLAGAYKLGAWYHTGSFVDQRFGIDAAGGVVTLAAMPDSRLNHSNNWGMYGLVDQMIWRNGTQSASLFVRGSFAPPDRNLLSWYVDGGIGFKGLVPGRGDDKLTLGFGYSKISKDSVALDQDTIALTELPHPIRDAEAVFELSYVAR